MSYAAAIDQLNAMVPELYTQSGQPRRKFSLEEVRVLLHALEDPQLRFPSLLIAGTNGKGSTASTLASILSASGLRAGLFTSPHLMRVNERIRVGSAEIDDEVFAGLYFRVNDVAQELVLQGCLTQLPSFFEMLTAQALVYFAEGGVDIAVLEVGMGGRLDATNIVTPLLSVITDISLDHTEWLGSTIAAITREKAGILRPNGTLVTLPQHPEANQVLGEVAMELGVRGVSAVEYMPPHPGPSPYQLRVLGQTIGVQSPLAGAHQQRNVALAIAAAVELRTIHNFPVTAASIEEGVRQTRWPARLERIERAGRQWILDVAHNPAGAWALRAGLSSILAENIPSTLIFSCLRDKPVTEMAQILFPLFAQVIFAPIHSPRAASMEELQAAAKLTGTAALTADSVSQALQVAKGRCVAETIVICGSFYLVGEARSLLMAGREA